MKRSVIIGLGSNIGDRQAHIETALAAIGAELGTPVRTSRLYLTDPIGPPQAKYINAAVHLVTELSAQALLERLLGIEQRLGRTRTRSATRNLPRTIDLDVLWIDGESHVSERLTVPHPRLFERAFALTPLLEVWPDAPESVHQALRALGGPIQPID